jgi:hypothetical protein
MSAPAREQLVVYWDGEEVAGFIVFALRERSSACSLRKLDLGWMIEPDQRSSFLVGETWEVGAWYIKVAAWPPAETFRESISTLLHGLIDEGWSVAWVGVEGSFVDPPELFSPEAMPGGVLAACSTDTGLIEAVDLDLPLQALTDSRMLALREASRGLASSV